MPQGPQPKPGSSKEAILAATRRVIAERGPDGFTMTSIANEADVSRPTLYKWFPTREELLEAFTRYEEEVFAARLHAVVEAESTPAARLDAAIRLLVTYLDGLMGPDPIGADPAYAIQSLHAGLEPQVDAFVRLLGDAFRRVPAVRRGEITREQAAELFLRLAYSHYLIPHPDPEVLLANLRSFAGLKPAAVRRAS
jgi:AcrR family transcriptional regulator